MSPILSPAERAAQINRRMTPGTLRGVSRVASPRVSEPKRMPYTELPPEMTPKFSLWTGSDDMPPGTTASGTPQYSGPPVGTFAITSFAMTVSEITFPDGVPTRFELHNRGHEGEDLVVAVVEAGDPVAHAGGTYQGTILVPTVTITGTGYTLDITGASQVEPPWRVSALFDTPGEAVELPWTPAVGDTDA